MAAVPRVIQEIEMKMRHSLKIAARKAGGRRQVDGVLRVTGVTICVMTVCILELAGCLESR